MGRWLRILVICLSLAAFLARNTAALGDCHHDHDDDAALLVSATFDDLDGEDRDQVPPTHDSPCEAPGGCVHCTVAKMPCAAADITPSVVALSLEDVLPETSLSYSPPSAGCLIRPPR
jgi:hypothetical protein